MLITISCSDLKKRPGTHGGLDAGRLSSPLEQVILQLPGRRELIVSHLVYEAISISAACLRLLEALKSSSWV